MAVNINVENTPIYINVQDEQTTVEVADGTLIISDGTNNSVTYLRVAEGYLQYSSDNETWTNIATFQNGKDGEDGKDGQDGYTPQKGVDYFDGKDGQDGDDGVGIQSIQQTTTSSADDGNNVFTVTLTNGQTSTFTVKNGSKGSTGPQGPAGSDANVTTENITNALGYTPANHQDLSEYAKKSTTLSGYGITDGATKTEVNALSEQIDNLDLTVSEAEKDEIVQEALDSIIVQYIEGGLGNNAIYGDVDSDNNIIIHGELQDGTYTVKYEAEDGTTTDIGTLTLGAKPLVPNFTNLADPTSSDWLTDNRLNSSGGGTANEGLIVTNYISVTNGDVIRVKGLDMTNGAARIAGYGGSKNVQFSASLSSTNYATNKTVGTDESVFTLSYSGIAFLRVSGGLNGKAEDVIVTKNEEITYS